MNRAENFKTMLNNRFAIEELLKKYGFIKEFNEGDSAQEYFEQGNKICDFTTELEEMMKIETPKTKGRPKR